MVAAALPAAGLRPRRLILLDPPALPVATMEAVTRDPEEQRYGSIEAAVAALRAAEPTWSEGDVRAKAEGLTRFDPAAVRQVLAENGDWDAGLSELPAAVAAGIPVWIVRGEERAGGMIPDAFVPRLARVVGADRVVTIAGAPHSPQRVLPEATVLAILRALGDPARATRAHGGAATGGPRRPA
jgi:pimeloyl-ACP methyl ester carboxylesterase